MYQKLCRPNKKIKACDVYIGGNRKYGGWNLNESKWAIPMSLAKLKPEDMQPQYLEYLKSSGLISQVPFLAHQLLGCWCETPNICHAAVLNDCISKYLTQPCNSHRTGSETDAKAEPSLLITKEPVMENIKFKIKINVAKANSSINVADKATTIESATINVADKAKGATTKDNTEGSVATKGNTEGTITFHVPLAFNPIEWTAPPWLPSKVITSGCVKTLKTAPNVDLNWFNCRVLRIIRNKTTERFALEISDGSVSTRVEIGQQLNEPLACRFIGKDDLIHVEHFAWTNIYNGIVFPDYGDFAEQQPKPKLKKRFIMLTSIYKIPE